METLKIDKMHLDGGTQTRARLNDNVVEEYAQLMRDGAAFPPVVVYHDGLEYWLADGFHRVRAAQKAGLAQLPVEIYQGTVQDAQWHSFGANKAHGVQRSNEDKERAVRAALRHPKSVGLSDRELARHLGVHGTTVGKYRLEMESSAEIQQIDQRTVTRGENTYQQKTTKIGRKGRKTKYRGVAPDAFTPVLGHSNPPPMVPLSLPRENPQLAAAALIELFDTSWLTMLVQHISTHLQSL